MGVRRACIYAVVAASADSHVAAYCSPLSKLVSLSRVKVRLRLDFNIYIFTPLIQFGNLSIYKCFNRNTKACFPHSSVMFCLVRSFVRLCFCVCIVVLPGGGGVFDGF